jgi:myo-inositol-1(or 4)-monophosphatase
MNRPLDTAIGLAQEAGRVLLDYYERGFSVRAKAASDLVTDADVAAERVIAAGLRATFPDHEILAEEEHSGRVDAEHLWIVDPLDGTTNFAHGIPHYAVSIAYLHRGQTECGVVWNPAREDLYHASVGAGAWHNGQPMSVNSERSMNESLIGIGFYYDRGAMMEATLRAVGSCFRRGIHGVRRFGTASLDLAHVASGLYGAYFEYQLSPWDFAAGRLLVEEAGGIVTNCQGQPLAIKKTSVLASNGQLHQEMLQTVSSCWST